MLVRLPLVGVDSVAEDFLDATRGSVLSDRAAPFAFVDGEALSVEVDGVPLLVSFNEADFDDIEAASAAEVLNVLNATLGAAATATEESGRIRISTATYGSGGSVEVVAEPLDPDSDPAFDFTAGLQAGADATDQTVLVNRVPEPGETAVPRGDAVELELYATGGVAPLLSGVDLDVDGLPVLVAGAQQAGWLLVASNPDPATLRLVLSPPALFGSDAEVTLHVVSGSLDETYSWRSADETSPDTLAASATAKKVVRVTFSEPVRQVDATAAGDALNPASYAIERVSRPAVTVRVVGVEPVSASEVDLLLDIEMSFGAQYRLYSLGVLDLAGNAHVLPPENSVDFVGFLPPFPAGRRFLLTDFVPAMNLAEDATGELRLFLACLQEVANLLLCSIDEWWDIQDPDLAPEAFVDSMLEELGNPFGDMDLSDADKRRLCLVLVDLYKLRGTTPGHVAAVRFLTGVEVEVETFNGTGWELAGPTGDGGDELAGPEELDEGGEAELGPDRAGLYSFRYVSPVTLTETLRDRFLTIATVMRVAHEHYLGVVEPEELTPIDHLELGFSELGGPSGPGTWELHE